MIKVIIVDDEQHCTDRVISLLKQHSEKFELVATANSVEDGIAIADLHKPALVFLDVHIGNKTGFDFLQSFTKIPFDVIFTTGFEKYAVRAFKFSALDYLIKPIDTDDFANALKKFTTKSDAKHLVQKMDVLLHNIKTQNAVKKITVPTMDGFEFLEVSDIIHCKADVNYTDIHLKNGKKLTVSKTLKSFEELLVAEHFFRVHKSHLVNLREVKKYLKGKSGFVTMTDNSNIEVSTRRKEEFIRQLTM